MIASRSSPVLTARTFRRPPLPSPAVSPTPKPTTDTLASDMGIARRTLVAHFSSDEEWVQPRRAHQTLVQNDSGLPLEFPASFCGPSYSLSSHGHYGMSSWNNFLYTTSCPFFGLQAEQLFYHQFSPATSIQKFSHRRHGRPRRSRRSLSQVTFLGTKLLYNCQSACDHHQIKRSSAGSSLLCAAHATASAWRSIQARRGT